MSTSVEFFDYKNSLWFKVYEFIIAKGFTPASNVGCEIEVERRSFGFYQEAVHGISIGILLNDPHLKPMRLFWGLITRSPRRVFFCSINFLLKKNALVFDVYGRENVGMVVNLANEIASVFKVKVSVNLTSEKPDKELFANESKYSD